MVLSKHAERRCKSRSIPQRVIELIMTYGKQEKSRHDLRFSMDRRGFEEMLAYEDRGEIKRFEHKLRAYLIVAEGDVLVTAAYEHGHPRGLNAQRR